MKKIFIITILSLLVSIAAAQDGAVAVKYNKDLTFEVSDYGYSTNNIYIIKKDFQKNQPRITFPFANNGDKFESIERLYQIFNEVFTAKELQQLADIDTEIEVNPYWNPDGKVFEVSFFIKRKKDYSEKDPYLKQISITLSKLVKIRDLFIKEIQFQPTSPQLIKSLPYCRTDIEINFKDIVARTFVWEDMWGQ